MHLQFHYASKSPGIEKLGDDLHIGLMNASCGRAVESWTLPTGRYERHGDFKLFESSEYVLGAASIEVCPGTLTAKTESLYEQLLSNHPSFSLYRIWNFVPDINGQPEGHLENYQAFCLGRATAFERHVNNALHSKVPAASAVGTPGDHLTLVYLAGRPLGTHLENPQQTPAYEYPEQYGPKPPSFARASTVDYDGHPTLFISGTASVLASESIGETVESQLATTLDNLHAVASQCHTTHTGRRRARVYLRHAGDYDYVKTQLEASYLKRGDEATYIVADICRKELLVEIEVTIGL
jgi:enamine deaminase RidA (YjgF/YER057c/UK114 family)